MTGEHSLRLLVLVLGCQLALGCQRGGGGPQPSDGEMPAPGQFLSDSLGVSMTLPDSPGWSFHRDPQVPGGPYVTALHASQNASVRLFVHSKRDVEGVQEVVRRRRDQLAGHFQVRNLDDVVEKVLQEDRREIDGFPAWLWQAVTEPVAVAGSEVSRVMFMMAVVERADRIFESVGVMRFPVQPNAEQQATSQGLERDLAFLMQSLHYR